MADDGARATSTKLTDTTMNVKCQSSNVKTEIQMSES
jgi:hypothetical protein